MRKSIGRTFPQIDVAANFSVRIHEDFFNTHRDYHHLILPFQTTVENWDHAPLETVWVMIYPENAVCVDQSP